LVAQWGSSANPYRFAGAWGYRDDGDAGLFYVGARYYDPAVGRWTSADKWLGDLYRPLSLNRYLYCEDEPVNYVDPSGNIPQWVKDWAKTAWEWTKEHASDIRKGIGVVTGTLIGIKLAVEIYIVFVDWDTSNRMRDMLEDWKPKHPDKVDWDLINRVRNQHIQDAMRNVGQAVGDVAERIYKVRPSR
jgi:RHS repeat-associated protein